MLDVETKRRIDAARDILVGKVPNPQGQVEQITIALIYKFMDDMDHESMKMGGQASFFTGEYEKYAWTQLFDPQLGGREMLDRYAEAITRMDQNPGIPQFFRDIFKNANLPYRDPATLKLFLKTINDFTYDHSERLGDAFEYLLSVLSSQGDAGMFRTPRHIIDFMVEILNPQKNERILDPSCGTAGFLISAYKHIKRQNDNGKALTPQELMDLPGNFCGYDISPEMVRLSLVNMYLHGFTQPGIHEYDTLTSDERWNEYADVILANPPFMTPTGGIRPHSRFSVKSNRSEVLFVDYIAEHLTPNGRAAIIVPEGIIFQTGKAYKELRKNLVENNYLWAVISLPAGVFNPYAGVKTSILLLDRELAKKTDKILFVKVEADGYDLGAQRKPIERNDLPAVVSIFREYQNNFHRLNDVSKVPINLITVKKELIAANGEFHLNYDRYIAVDATRDYASRMVMLSEIAFIEKGSSITKSETREGTIPVIAGGQSPAYFHDIANREPGVITVSASGAYAGFLNYFDVPIFASDCTTLKSKDENQIRTLFLYRILKGKQNEFYGFQLGMGQPHVYAKDFRNFQIPLPSIDNQDDILEEIEGYQKIIDGARQVVENWKPNIEWELEEERRSAGVEAWPMVKLGEVCEKVVDQVDPKEQKGDVIYIGLENIGQNIGILVGEICARYEDIKSTKNKFSSGDILFGKLRPNLNKVYLSELTGICSTDILVLRAKENINPEYLSVYLRTTTFNSLVLKGISGSQLPRVSFEYMAGIPIPLPPLYAQSKIQSRINQEFTGIQSNRRLIQAYEVRIRKVVERVWE
jgi:type I restriction enzyme M protein